MRSRSRTMGQIRARNATGPFSWKSALLFVLTGAGMIVYFRVEKDRLERKRIAEMSKGVGKPKVGGPFVLKDLEGKVFTEEELKGRYSFVYFGFTHCPDICPDELDKMAEIIDKVKEANKGDNVFLPVFITCDPVRDTPEVLKNYLQEFHKDIIGLTGTYDQVKQVCKAYRVYFSTPRDVKPGDDYLVDHSIYFYLMDPDGDFVECIGRQDTPESATKTIMEHINDWKREGKPLKKD
ncbi:SCO1/SenC-domain-containing protein [Aspergillus germanicus]